ncbi:MAG: DUF3549 family protein [Psychrobium sp.]
MDTINTLSEFLLQSGSQYRVFDMGRRVTKISTDLFSDFEHAITPYPYPIQQHAFVAIAFWNKQQSKEHYVWFLKLPLDERGLLEQAARSQFLELVITALGKALDKTPSKEEQSALDHNPIIFKPSEQKLAAFTSHMRHLMKLPPSQFMSPALSYLQDESQLDNWQNVGYQGLADLSVRLDDPMIAGAIERVLDKLPQESFCALCCALENSSVNTAMADKLLTILEQALTENNAIRAIHAARALSNAKGEGFIKQAYQQLIQSELGDNQLDLLATISGRYWTQINDEQSALDYLEKVAAANVSQDIFGQLFSDLVFIPNCRIAMLSALRNPNRTNHLANYIAKFIGA